MNPSEIKAHVVYRGKIWNTGAAGEVTLGNLTDLAVAHFSIPQATQKKQKPFLLVNIHGAKYRYPDDETLEAISNTAQSYDLLFILVIK